jgi:hypothetical protein
VSQSDHRNSPGWLDGERWLVLFKGNIFVPEASILWTLLVDAHDSGHEGIQKTLHRWRALYYNPCAAAQVREFVQVCTIFQRNKSEHLHTVDLLQPLLLPSEVWADISMNFVEGFPKVGSKSVILTV